MKPLDGDIKTIYDLWERLKDQILKKHSGLEENKEEETKKEESDVKKKEEEVTEKPKAAPMR